MKRNINQIEDLKVFAIKETFGGLDKKAKQKLLSDLLDEVDHFDGVMIPDIDDAFRTWITSGENIKEFTKETLDKVWLAWNYIKKHFFMVNVTPFTDEYGQPVGNEIQYDIYPYIEHNDEDGSGLFSYQLEMSGDYLLGKERFFEFLLAHVSPDRVCIIAADCDVIGYINEIHDLGHEEFFHWRYGLNSAIFFHKALDN